MIKAGVFFFFLFIANLLRGQPVVTKYFEWFQKNHIIQSPVFSDAGINIAFVKRFTNSDSIKTTFPIEEKIAENLLPKTAAAARFKDPVVALLNTQSRHLTLIDYGWSPTFSLNGRKLVYAHQQNPVGEKKIIATTLKGNDIRLFDISLKTSRSIAQTKGAFLLDPVFIDSLNVIYKTGDAINGPFGGGIAFNKVNIKTNKQEILRGAKIQYRLYELMGDVYQLNKGFAYTVYSPQDSGTGMANEYAHLLITEKDTLHNFGTRYFENLEYNFAITADSSVIYLDDNHLMAEDTSYIVQYKNEKPVYKKPINFPYAKAYISPDGKKMLYITNELEAFVVNILDFKKTQLPLPKKPFYTIVWSADASKLAVVQDHSTIEATDALYLFRVR